ncbi:hypothetical protein DFP72DRAFT_821144, partial [Ephemerocybe angulata]
QPFVLLFFDSKVLAVKVARYLSSLLPSSMAEEKEEHDGIICYYHSDMSELYLDDKHTSFNAATGKCRVLCATSGLSLGVDFARVDIVCTVGLPSSIVEALQRGGRGARQPGDRSRFIIFYEKWALSISLDDYGTYGNKNNSDRTRAPLTSKSMKQDHALYGAVKCVQLCMCLRAFFAGDGMCCSEPF